MTTFLSAEDIERLTGYKRQSMQMRQLYKMGFWKAERNRYTGNPILTIEHYNEVASTNIPPRQSYECMAAAMAMPPPLEGPNVLYRHFDADGVLLYVGVSVKVLTRVNQHRGSDWFKRIAKITLEHHESRKSALDAERLAISNEGPLFNRQGKPA